MCMHLKPCTRSEVTAAMPAGTVAGIGGVLRAKAVRKSTRRQSRSRSRTRSPCGREDHSEHSTADEGVEDQSGGMDCISGAPLPNNGKSTFRGIPTRAKVHGVLPIGSEMLL